MKKVLRAIGRWLGQHWRGVVVSVLISVLAVITLSLQLTSLVPGANQFERETLSKITNLPTPQGQLVNAPYTVPAHIIGNLLNDPLQGARVVSVIYGLAAVGLFFYLVRLWFNIRIATVGSLLLITSSWLLQITHQATPLILLTFGPLLAVAPLAWFLRTKKHKTLAFFILVVALALAVYIPYMVWVLGVTLAIIIFYEKRLLSTLKRWQLIIAGVIYAIILGPLFISLVNYPSQLYELLGIPKVLPSLTIYFDQLAYTLSMIVFRSAPLPELHLGHLALLDIFSSAMMGLGIIYFASQINNRRSVILFACVGLLLVLIPLSSQYQLNATILMPFVYLLIVGGIIELLNQWFSYFPRNPWARNLGVILIVIAIGLVSFYHMQRYFVAWPNAPETKAVYVVKS